MLRLRYGIRQRRCPERPGNFLLRNEHPPMSLSTERCEACHVDSPRVTAAEEHDLVSQIPDWKLIEVDGERRLERVYRIKGWRPAMDFSTAVGDLADREDHHPAILTEWGKVTVTWWTHAIHGLHRNDFIMAAKTDNLFDAREWSVTRVSPGQCPTHA